jgi:hypothetical protein
MGEEGLATILRKSRLIDLIAVIDRGTIEETLEREDFRVLILPAGVGGEADHRRFLEIRPDICVLIIDLAESETSLRFRDIDGETLARLINSLSEEPVTPRVVSAERVHWLRRDDLRLLGTANEDEPTAEPYPDGEVARPSVDRKHRNSRVRSPGSPQSVDFVVGVAGFEPTTPCPPDKCANRAALHSDAHEAPWL